MPHAALSATIARARRAVAPESATDGQLLGAFLASRDASSFAELVARFGPMVFAVCRRLTGHHHDAEDAFQAAFVVLAKKAATVSPREAVGNWLYGVAVRVAREARAVSARRRAREVPAHPLPDVAQAAPDSDDLAAVLHQELAELPEKFRALLVLCDLRGEAQVEVAARLGLPAGTVYSRLAKARQALAARLRKRGVAVVALTAYLAGAGTAAVPRSLATRAVAAVASPDSLPPAVASLADGALRTMFLQKITLTAVAILVVAGLVVASALPDAPAQEPPKARLALALANTPDEPKAEPVAKSTGKIILGRAGAYWVLAPDGKKLGELPIPDKTRSHANAVLSPDGKRVAHVVTAEGEPEDQPGGAKWPYRVVVGTLDKPKEAKEWDMPAVDLSLCWTPDGKKLVGSKLLSRVPVAFESVVLDPETGKTEKLGDFRVLECLKGGKTYLVESYDAEKKVRSLAMWSAADKEPRVLTRLSGYPFDMDARLSPDGKTVLFIDADRERKDAYEWGCSQRVYLLDLATKKREKLVDFPENGKASGIAWSPDGKSIAYAWKQLHEELLKKDTISANDPDPGTEGFLVVADPDGSNAKTIASEKGPFAINMVFGAIDWR
jgi:RNA polymerase sigma factor (sigma-70 family)